jgi:hypothetical protein
MKTRTGKQNEPGKTESIHFDWFDHMHVDDEYTQTHSGSQQPQAILIPAHFDLELIWQLKRVQL